MSRAFDAVSKNLQAIAWRRLGVPEDVADWLVDMDQESQWYAPPSHKHDGKKMLTFVARGGTAV